MLISATVTGDAKAIARVHIDTWRHTYAGVMPAEYLAGLRYDRSRRGWESFLVREGVRVFVADDPEAGVVGFASAGPNTSTGDEGGERPAYESNLYAIWVAGAVPIPAGGYRSVSRTTITFVSGGEEQVLAIRRPGRGLVKPEVQHGRASRPIAAQVALRRSPDHYFT